MDSNKRVTFGGTTGQQSSGGFSFGGASTGQQSSGGFNFGGASTGQQSSGGFNFGGASTGQQGSTQPSGGFNFGGASTGQQGSTQPSSGGFNFGGASTGQQGSTQPTSGGFNFGGTSTGQQGSTQPSGGFNFGGTSTGQPTTFGTPNKPISSGQVGATPFFSPITAQSQPSGMVSTSMQGFGSGQPAAMPSTHWMQEVTDIIDAYNVKHRSCRFISVVYDRFDPKGPRGRYQWPSHLMDLYKYAQQQNPDPDKYVPYVIKGVEGLKKRAQGQDAAEKQLAAKMAEMEAKVNALQDKLEHIQVNTVPTLQRGYMDLAHRFLKCSKTLDCVRGYHATLTSREQQVARDATDLYRTIQQLPEKMQNLESTIDNPSMLEPKEYDTLDAAQEEAVSRVLRSHRDIMKQLEAAAISSAKAAAALLHRNAEGTALRVE